MKITPEQILDVLSTVRYPGNSKSLVANNMVEDLHIEDNKVVFTLVFDKSTDPFVKSVVRMAETALEQKFGQDLQIKGNINVKFRQEPSAGAAAAKPILPGVKNIIGISSGKEAWVSQQ